MATQEALLRANYKYIKNNVHQICLKFYPKDHGVLDKAKAKATDQGYDSFTAYVLDLIKKDLGE